MIMGVAVWAGQGSKPLIRYCGQPESCFDPWNIGQYDGEYCWWQVCTQSSRLLVHVNNRVCSTSVVTPSQECCQCRVRSEALWWVLTFKAFFYSLGHRGLLIFACLSCFVRLRSHKSDPKGN